MSKKNRKANRAANIVHFAYCVGYAAMLNATTRKQTINNKHTLQSIKSLSHELAAQKHGSRSCKATAWNAIGERYERLQLHDQALEAYSNAHKSNPMDPMGQLGMVSVYLAMGELDKAYDMLLSIPTFTTLGASGLIPLARYCALKGNKNDALLGATMAVELGGIDAMEKLESYGFVFEIETPPQQEDNRGNTDKLRII